MLLVIGLYFDGFQQSVMFIGRIPFGDNFPIILVLNNSFPKIDGGTISPAAKAVADVLKKNLRVIIHKYI